MTIQGKDSIWRDACLLNLEIKRPPRNCGKYAIRLYVCVVACCLAHSCFGQLSDIQWVKVLASEGDSLKFTRDGGYFSNGTVMWRSSDGQPVSSINSYMPQGKQELKHYLRAFTVSDPGPHVYYTRSSICQLSVQDPTGQSSLFSKSFGNVMDIDLVPSSNILCLSRLWGSVGQLAEFNLSNNQESDSNLFYGGRHIWQLTDGNTLASGPRLLGSGAYVVADSSYPMAVSPNEQFVVQVGNGSVAAYRTIDGTLLWQRSVPQLYTFHVAVLNDNATIVYNTLESGEVVANFCDIQNGDIKGTCSVSAPIQAASPTENLLIAQWSWGPGFDMFAPRSVSPSPTLKYRYDAATNTCSPSRTLVEVESSWIDVRPAHLKVASGSIPVIVSTTRANSLAVRRTKNGTLVRTLPLGEGQTYAFAGSGDYYVVPVSLSGIHYLEVRSTSNGKRKARRALPANQACTGLSWASNASIILESDSHALNVFSWEGQSLILQNRFVGLSVGNNLIAVSSSGARLAHYASDLDRVRVLATDGTELGQISTPAIDALRFATDDRLAIHWQSQSGGASAPVYHQELDVYDITATPVKVAFASRATNGRLAPNSGDPNPPVYQCFDLSPDGQTVVFGEAIEWMTPWVDPSVNAAQCNAAFHIFRLSDGADLRDITYPFEACTNPFVKAIFGANGGSMQVYTHPVVYSIAVP
jgi:hypothetical protein